MFTVSIKECVATRGYKYAYRVGFYNRQYDAFRDEVSRGILRFMSLFVGNSHFLLDCVHKRRMVYHCLYGHIIMEPTYALVCTARRVGEILADDDDNDS